MMKPLNDLSSNELCWVRPKRKGQIYELRSQDEVFATVTWKGCSTAAVLVESASGNWTITRQGLTQTIRIKDTSSQMDLAAVKQGISGNVTLSTADGRAFFWRCRSFWRGIWSWDDAAGRPLLHIKRSSSVQLEGGAQDLPELALLLTLGWYLYKQQDEETAFVGAMVAIIG